MKPVFADTSFYVALQNRADENHEAASDFLEEFDGLVVTSAWVLTELANYLAGTGNRNAFVRLLGDLRGNPQVTIVPCSQDLFDRGVEYYAARADKRWSLTDCISFLIMGERGLIDALTTDHHFEQAGFVALLKA